METNQAKLYDRQIQIFGAETQKVISSTEVLIAGLNTVTMETAKNLALIGFNIALADSRPLTKEDINCSPLLGVCDETYISRPIDEVIRIKLLDINPHVDVRIVSGPLESAFQSNTHILISISQSFEVQISTSAKLKDIAIVKFYLFQTNYTFLAIAELPNKPFNLSDYTVDQLRSKLKVELNLEYSFSVPHKSFIGDFVLQCVCGSTFNQTILTLISRQKLEYNVLYLTFNEESDNPSDHRRLECLTLK